MNIKLIILVVLFLNYTGTSFADTYYISPNGDDSNNGEQEKEAWKSFDYAFFNIEAGDELILLDGHYSVKNESGGIHWNRKKYPYSAQIPMGISLSQQTVVRGKNAGKVFVDVPLFIGRKKRKDSFITIKNITFKGGRLFNTSYITIKNVGFSDQFIIGTNDHHNGNSYNLVEDVWIWASRKRIIAMNYRSNKNVWRRVVVRGDGCILKKCRGSGNPNVGFTVYDSSQVSVQNVIVVDRILDGGKAYADFATAQHTSKKYFLGRNEWLGIISINSEDNGLIFEADHAILDGYTWTIKNALILDSKRGGINIGKQPYNGSTMNIVENSTIILSKLSKKDGLRLAPGQDKSIVRNNIVVNAGRNSINSASTFSHVISYNPKKHHYKQKKCNVGCYNINPFKEIWGLNGTKLSSVTEIPKESSYKSKGLSGGVIGATIVYRYGTDGTRYGDTDYNTLSKVRLWPWPNEKRLSNEMCISRHSNMCNSSLTRYIQDYLNNSKLQ